MLSMTGAYFAETTIFLNITSVLSTFNISKAKNKDRQEIEPDASFAPGIIRHVYFLILLEVTNYSVIMQAP